MKKRQCYPLLLLPVVFCLLIACNNEKTASALKVTDIPITTKSSEAKTLFENGLAFADEANQKKAIDAFNEAIKKDPNLAAAYLYKANLSFSAKEFMDNLAEAKKHLSGSSDWEKMYYDYLNASVNADWNKQLEAIQKIATKYPNAARAQVELGNIYQQAHQTDKARAAYQKAVELSPNWVGGYNGLLNSYLFEDPKDFNKAEQNGLKAAEVSPSSSGAQVALGDCYRAQNNLDRAKACYAKALLLDPDDPVAYYKKGHVNSFLGQYDEARNDYMEGIKHDINNLGAMLNIGNTYLYAGDYKAALQSFNDNLAKVDASSQSKSRMAIDKLNYLNAAAMTSFHYNDLPQLEAAVKMMQAPSDQVAEDIGSQEEKLLQKSNLLYWQALTDALAGKIADAKAKAEQIKTTLDPVKSPTKLEGYEMVMGYISMKEKNYADAITHFDKASPSSIYTKYWQAMANEAAGNAGKATELFKKISVYNFNEIGYAVVRNEVKMKVGM